MRSPLSGLAILSFVACGGSDISVKEAGEAVCNGVLDEEETAVDEPFDVDGDGLFDIANPGCLETYGPDELDCDDDDPDVTGPVDWYPDEDEDGHGGDGEGVPLCDAEDGYADNSNDCDDTLASVYPGADEYCDEIDNDCDDVIDEDAVNGLTYYRDADVDGYGNEDDSLAACDKPTGYSEALGDCDDGDPQLNPGAEEICFDSLDNNCDEQVDEGCDVDFSGSWVMDTEIAYSCGSLVDFEFDTVSVFETAPTISVTSIGSSKPGTMTGEISSTWEVIVSSFISSACNESYTLSGTFIDEAAFEGTFQASFSGECGECSPTVWPVILTR